MALFWEMGTGKTAAMINILRVKYTQHKQLLNTLILAPLVVLNNWKREFAMHSTVDQEKITVINKSGKARLKLMDNVKQGSIVVVNYEALQSKDFAALIREWGPRILVCDESHLVKNYKSKRAKAVRDIADTCLHRFLLTGTPILNACTDIWMQYRILDGGELFGKSTNHFFAFRAKFQYNEMANIPRATFPKWVDNPLMLPKLNKHIYGTGKASRILKKECLDLPPLVVESREVELSAEQKRTYKEMKRDYITFVKKKLEEKPRAAVAELAVTRALRLLTITTGFIKDEKDMEHEIKDNPRLAVTKELLEQLTIDHKVIVWCAFKLNVKMIARVCEELGVEYVTLTGEQNLGQKQESIDNFNTGSARVIIANRSAGGTGINLTAASYSIVYSRNYSLNDEKQSEARNYRGGSEIHEKVTKINLVTPSTIDEKVLRALENKQKIADIILDLDDI